MFHPGDGNEGKTGNFRISPFGKRREKPGKIREFRAVPLSRGSSSFLFPLGKGGSAGKIREFWERRDSHGKSRAGNAFPRFCRSIPAGKIGNFRHSDRLNPDFSGSFQVLSLGKSRNPRDPSRSFPFFFFFPFIDSRLRGKLGKTRESFSTHPEGAAPRKNPQKPGKFPKKPRRDSRQIPLLGPRPDPDIPHGNIPGKIPPGRAPAAPPGASQSDEHSRGIFGKNGIPGRFRGGSREAEPRDIPGFQKIFWRLGRTASLRKEKTRRIPERFPLFPLVK